MKRSIWNEIHGRVSLCLSKDAVPIAIDNSTVTTTYEQGGAITDWLVKWHEKGFLLGPVVTCRGHT